MAGCSFQRGHLAGLCIFGGLPGPDLGRLLFHSWYRVHPAVGSGIGLVSRAKLRVSGTGATPSPDTAGLEPPPLFSLYGKLRPEPVPIPPKLRSTR